MIVESWGHSGADNPEDIHHNDNAYIIILLTFDNLFVIFLSVYNNV